jgi:nucleoside-diphosphate-sugar epimerase
VPTASAPSTPRRALVCGAAGFIGGHLVERLVADGFWVRGVDQRQPAFRPTAAHELVVADLRTRDGCEAAFAGERFDHVYQLAADMGGMEFIWSAECEILQNSTRINLDVLDAARRHDAGRYFLSSSVCVYRDMMPGDPPLTEDDAYPAAPDNEYGWEKLYAERSLFAAAAHSDLEARVARFENTFGPYGTWRGGREKAPAAICRKVAEADDGGVIEAFGDGSAVRCFTYVDDLVDGIRLLMESDRDGPVNLGSGEYVTVRELIETVIRVSGKDVDIRYVPGPVGVHSRNFSGERARSLGFAPRFDLEAGIRETYRWIEAQVAASRADDGTFVGQSR